MLILCLQLVLNCAEVKLGKIFLLEVTLTKPYLWAVPSASCLYCCGTSCESWQSVPQCPWTAAKCPNCWLAWIRWPVFVRTMSHSPGSLGQGRKRSNCGKCWHGTLARLSSRNAALSPQLADQRYGRTIIIHHTIFLFEYIFLQKENVSNVLLLCSPRKHFNQWCLLSKGEDITNQNSELCPALHTMI